MYKIIYIAIYSPSRSNSDYKNIIKKIKQFIFESIQDKDNETSVILQGDLNECPNDDLDRNRSYVTPKKNLNPFLTQSCTLIDIYRFLHPHKMEYTYEQLDSKSRIDLTYVSPNIAKDTNDISILSKLDQRLHHHPIKLTLNFDLSQKNFNPPPQSESKFKINLKDITKKEINDFNRSLKKLTNTNNIECIFKMLNKNLLQAAKNSFQVTLTDPKYSIPDKRPKCKKAYKGTYKLLFQIQDDNTELELRWKLIYILLKNFKLIEEIKTFELTSASPENIYQYLTVIQEKLERLIHSRKRKAIKKAMNRRAKQFIHFQKQHIMNIFDHKRSFATPFYLKKTENQIIMDDLEINTEIESYFKKIYNENGQKITSKQDFIHDIDHNIYTNISDKFSMAEMQESIQQLGRNKTPGLSQISNDLIKLISNQEYLHKILQMLNLMLAEEQFPEIFNIAKIILIPKSDQFDGDLSKTRPITLIDTFKKLFSQLLTNRITKIINSNDILKGNNFGFTKDMSTKDPLMIIRLLIDDAKLTKNNFYMASLDVQKAYDSVPFQSIEQSLKRIKVPTQFINQVRKILTRKVFIESPAGRTNIFSAERGLPQGDPMSPILWNIFYDELLTNLQSKIGYKLYHTINISVLAYADDIHPISHRKEVLQDMLADIELFLKSHKMSLNATKSKILTNDDQSNYEFKINQQTIQLVPKTELVRILGVYWSMDGNYKATIKKTMTELINQIVAIQYKFIPGKIMTHLINTVIIPTIKYRLQYIPISDNQLEKVDKRLRSLTRLKNKLPPTTKNDYIYCNEFGIKLFSIKNIHKNTIITDLTVFLRNDNITSKVIRAVLEKLRLKMRFPLPLINKPVKLQNNSFIKYVINLFHRENLSIKQTHVGQFEQILLEMPLEDYISGRKIMFDLNLSNLQLPSNKQLLLSFNDLTNHWPRLKKAIFDKVPNWYQFIMQKMSNCQDDYSQQFNYRIPIYIKEEQETIYKIPEEKTELEIWTDGSLKKESNKMGAGFLIWDTQENIIHKQSIKVDSQNPSSTKAELIGILAALDICHTNQTIRIYTDSQCAINGCKNILVKESSRTELKYKNLYILEQIKAVMLQFSKIPTFIKVAGHSNLLKNDQADELAKLGAESSLENYQVGIGSVKEYLFKNNTIVNGYPNQFLKKIRQEKQFGLIETNLNEKWEFSDIDWKDTLKVCYQGMNLENALDATDVKEQSFRIRFFSKKLPVLSLVKKWNYNNNTYTENSICPRCKKEEETLQHLITCDKNKTISSKLYNTTIESINERLNTNPTYKNLNEQHFKPSKKHLMYLLGFQNFQEFTTLPSAYGLINQTLIDRFKKTKRTKNHTKLWIQLVLDSWLTTVYKIIWTERCKDLKQSQEQNHQNKRKSNSEHHTIKKIKLINYSKISLFTSLAEHPKKINLSTSKILPKPIMLITSHARNPQKIRLKPKIRSRVTSQRNKPRTTTTYIDSSPLTNNLTSKRRRKQTGHYEQDHFKKIKLKLGSPQKISIKLKIPPDKTMNDRGEDPMSAMVSMVGAEDEEGGEGPRFNETVGSV